MFGFLEGKCLGFGWGFGGVGESEILHIKAVMRKWDVGFSGSKDGSAKPF